MANASAVLARTLDLVSQHPLEPGVLVESVLQSWEGLTSSRIGRARIGVDVFPSPQVLGSFLHELIPLEVQSREGDSWRGDIDASEKDLMCLPDHRYSVEIKTSSHARQIFGNRSFGQADGGSGKKEKSGYYLAVNFSGWTRDGGIGGAPGVNLVRFGWLDHVDWLAQGASTGQAATLPPTVESYQLLTLFDVNR